MKFRLFLTCLLALPLMTHASETHGEEMAFDLFLSHFDYDTRADMKIDSKGLVALLTAGKAVLVDVRFTEEVVVWRTGFALNIPLNELPRRIKELPKDKTIVAACPHKDRSALAMAYLRSKGYDAKYLTDGLIGLAEYLRGERAKDFVEDMASSANSNQTQPVK
jgi:rhodanese-related sulfurtransferase